MKRKTANLAFMIGLAAAGQPALADWQCLSAGARVPAAARAASDYLKRAERVYPTQVLGLLRAGDRVYLVNGRDDGWIERVRLGLLELRLAEPDITAARRFQAALSGGPTPEASGIPAGEFVCLARERAARQGLAFRDEAILLATGKSIFLVDPIELTIAVEVRADGGQPLDLREIFSAGARAGIYAGLYKGRASSEPAVAARPAEVPVAIAARPIVQPDSAAFIAPLAAEAVIVEEKAVVTAKADVPPVQVPTGVRAASAPPVVEDTPVRVVKVDEPASAPAKPREASAAMVVASAGPIVIAAPAVTPATQGRPVAEQSYDDYAKTMKELMAIRLSGAVRSISEMTYVHPAVEDLRARR